MRENTETRNLIHRKNLIYRRFGVLHLAYIVSLVCAATALFGGNGAWIAAAVAAAWVFVFSRSRLSPGCAASTVILMLIVCLICLPVLFILLKPKSSRHACTSHAASLVSAYHQYELDKFRGLAPKVDRRKHSWRVMILPYLGERDLYLRYRLEEPWDSPNNLKLLDDMPEVFRCPEHDTGSETSYFLIDDPSRRWLSWRSGSLMMLEDHTQSVPWTQPVDLSPEQAIQLFGNQSFDQCPHVSRDGMSATYYGRTVVGGGGAIITVPPNVPQHEIRPLLFDRRNRKPAWEIAYEHVIPSELLPQGIVAGLLLILLTLAPIYFIRSDEETPDDSREPTVDFGADDQANEKGSANNPFTKP